MRCRLPLWIVGSCTAVLMLLGAQTAWATLWDLNSILPGSDPSSTLLHWSGVVDPIGPDLAGATWQLDVTASATDWGFDPDLLEWSLAAPADLTIASGSDADLVGTGTFEAYLGASDTDGTIDPFGFHQVLASGNINGNSYEGQVVIGGSWSMSAVGIVIADPVLDDGVPADSSSGFDDIWGGTFMDVTLETQSSAVPEPCSALLLLVAGGGLAAYRRRR
jgi:hypothetical protein